jgi:nucleoside 2-deoxyribosyltransferase
MNKRKLKLYLAHSLETRTAIRKIELEIEDDFNIELYNPFYDNPNRDDIHDIDSGKTTRWELDLKHCEDIVDRDLNAIDECDGIVAIFLDSSSIGTCLEIGYARQTGKMIFFISEKYYNHPWIRVYADYRFKNIDEFKMFLKYYKFNALVFKLKRKLMVVVSAYMILKIGISKLISKFPKRKKKTQINIEVVK